MTIDFRSMSPGQIALLLYTAHRIATDPVSYQESLYMDMLVVSGFLGSGKTTMILATIGKYIETTKKKVVIIVNDFGKIGIDGTVMKKYGLEVQDMPSGCICCTLGSDFLETVNTVATNFART